MFAQNSIKARFGKFDFHVRKSLKLLIFSICFLLISAATALPQTNFGELRKQADRAMRKGEFRSAEQVYRLMLLDEPENSKYRLGLSYALYKQRLLVESYQEAKKIAELEPGNSRAFALLGANLLGAGNFKQAKAAFASALNINDNEPLALAGYAMLDFHENRPSWGFVRLREAISLQPNEPDFVYYLAQVAARTENYKEAAAAYEKFLRIAPNTDTDRRERIQGLISFLRYLGAQKKLCEIDGKPQTTFAIEVVNNRPVLEVKINDSNEKLRFVLDSGSAATVLSDATAKRLGIREVARGGKARAIGGEGKFDIVYGFLDSLRLGDVKINRVPVYIRRFFNQDNAVDGYIGTTVISKFLTTIDYPNQFLSLVKQQKSDRNKTVDNFAVENTDETGIPLRITSSGFLSGEVRVDSIPEPLNFIVDTGASVSVINTETFKYYDLNRFAQPTMLKVFGAAGVTENVVSLNLPRVGLGKQTQEKIQAAVLDLQIINEAAGFEQAGIIGGNFLKNYRLTFDFVNAKILLKPSNGEKIKSAADAIVGENIKLNQKP